MNYGGEPGHDDYGLPRVDIQIPDDARELDRDVQAYHRELRALRRHERSKRWHTPLRDSGMILPLIAGCLVLAMVAGMVLTTFSGNPLEGFGRHAKLPAAQSGNASAGHPLRSSSPTSPSARKNSSGGPATGASAHLPAGNISVGRSLIDLSTVSSAALAIIPAACGCSRQVRRLVHQAVSARVTVYLVGRRGTKAQLERLAPPGTRGMTYVAIDTDDALNLAYSAKGVTLVLVDQQRHVTSAAPLHPGFHLQAALRPLGPVH